MNKTVREAYEWRTLVKISAWWLPASWTTLCPRGLSPDGELFGYLDHLSGCLPACQAGLPAMPYSAFLIHAPLLRQILAVPGLYHSLHSPLSGSLYDEIWQLNGFKLLYWDYRLHSQIMNCDFRSYKPRHSNEKECWKLPSHVRWDFVRECTLKMIRCERNERFSF